MNFPLVYGAMLVIRLALCVLPQGGYIHPDEFFQSVEIAADDVLHLQTNKPWEFDPRFAIRSKAIVDIFLNIPLRLYLRLDRLFLGRLVPFDLLTFCRVWTTACSVIVDVCLWTVADRFGANRRLALVLHATSHVALVWLTRTFSNSWETQLSALFLVAFYRRPTALSQLVQGAIVAIGFFCRPTFVLFVVAHVVGGIVSSSPRQSIRYALNGVAGFVGAAAVLASVDTAHYGGSDLVLAPVNFVAHNWRSDNLAQHGIHRWYTHALANVPLLLGVLCPLVLLPAPRASPRADCHKHRRWVLLLALALPVAALSAFPHQEMRFLLPVFVPGVLLAALALESLSIDRPRVARAVVVAHIACSALLVVFWGVVHEGGLLRATKLVRDDIAAHRGCHVAVTYRCLTVPLFLLELPHSHERCLHNLMGIDESQFWLQVANISRAVTANRTDSARCLLHLIFPKAYPFRQPELFSQLGQLRTNRTLIGHVNTDLWPPRVSLYDFISLQYLTFTF